jgi:hypothetical protein
LVFPCGSSSDVFSISREQVVVGVVEIGVKRRNHLRFLGLPLPLPVGGDRGRVNEFIFFGNGRFLFFCLGKNRIVA